MLVRLTLVSALAAAPLMTLPFDGVGVVPSYTEGQEQEGARPKVPKDSLLVNVIGCVKGRVIRAEDVRQPDTTSGVTIRNHTFRLAGKKNVMNLVKEVNGQRAEISGLIKKSALMEQGMRFKGGRIVIGGGSPTSTSSMPSPAENVVVLDAVTVTSLGGTCGS
jgi:hypothetical protein